MCWPLRLAFAAFWAVLFPHQFPLYLLLFIVPIQNLRLEFINFILSSEVPFQVCRKSYLKEESRLCLFLILRLRWSYTHCQSLAFNKLMGTFIFSYFQQTGSTITLLTGSLSVSSGLLLTVLKHGFLSPHLNLRLCTLPGLLYLTWKAHHITASSIPGTS